MLMLLSCESKEEKIKSDCLFPTGVNISEINLEPDWFLDNQDVFSYTEETELSTEDIASYTQEVHWTDSEGYFYSGIFISQCFESSAKAISVYDQVKIFYPESQTGNPHMSGFDEYDYVCGYNWQGYYKCNFVGRFNNQLVQLHIDIEGGFGQEDFSKLLDKLTRTMFYNN